MIIIHYVLNLRSPGVENFPTCESVCDWLDCPAHDGHCVKFGTGEHKCMCNNGYDNYPLCVELTEPTFSECPYYAECAHTEDGKPSCKCKNDEEIYPDCKERSEASVLCRIIPTATTNQYTGCPLVDTRPKLCMSKTY